MSLIRMVATDNPLVALAENLGIEVYLNLFEAPPGAIVPRYRLVWDGKSTQGDDLVETLTLLLRDRVA